MVLGFITNRLNVSITGQESAAGMHYIPKWTEIAVTGAIIAAGFALFGLAVKYLPIFPAEEQPPGDGESSPSSRRLLCWAMPETEPDRGRWNA